MFADCLDSRVGFACRLLKRQHEKELELLALRRSVAAAEERVLQQLARATESAAGGEREREASGEAPPEGP